MLHFHFFRIKYHFDLISISRPKVCVLFFYLRLFFFSLPYFDFGRRWIFLESDFRTKKISFSPSLMGCGKGWIFFESDFLTKKISFSPPLMGCDQGWIFSESDFWSQIFAVHHFIRLLRGCLLMLCRSPRVSWLLAMYRMPFKRSLREFIIF